MGIDSDELKKVCEEFKRLAKYDDIKITNQQDFERRIIPKYNEYIHPGCSYLLLQNMIVM